MRAVLEGHEGCVNGVACFVGADGKPRIVSASDDKTVRVWNPSSGEEEAVLKGHESRVNAVACFVGADGKPRIVSASGDKLSLIHI